MKRAIVSVINDLVTDQRVHKHCLALQQKGFEVLLIGRLHKGCGQLGHRPYATHRMWLPFDRGALFYASNNVALFFQLLFRRADLLFSNDLDTLLPNRLVAALRRIPLIYDSHEYFTEVPELEGRPVVKAVWRALERALLPGLRHCLTVNDSIAEIYRGAYGIRMSVLRNMPMRQPYALKTREQLGLPEHARILILQGSGINVQRGAEEAVEAMRHLPDDHLLLIIGSGDVIDVLRSMALSFGISDRVIFKDRMPYAEMMAHTRVCDLGLTLDKGLSLNYRLSLPNKLFDYIQAGIPVLGSDLPEVSKVILGHGVGEVLHAHQPEAMARQVARMLGSEELTVWRANCAKAAEELCWERESQVLYDMMDDATG